MLLVPYIRKIYALDDRCLCLLEVLRNHRNHTESYFLIVSKYYLHQLIHLTIMFQNIHKVLGFFFPMGSYMI